MSLERTMKMGQLKEREDEAKTLAIRMAGAKRDLRLYLPEVGKLEDLDPQRIHQLSKELGDAHERYATVLEEIAALREDLGLPRYEAR